MRGRGFSHAITSYLCIQALWTANNLSHLPFLSSGLNMKPIHIRRSPRLAILLLALVGHSEARASQLDDSSDTWPQWRGPNRDGTAPGEGWGADLSDENFGVKWEVNGLGPSYSGPVVDANRVYITETVDKTTEVVRALNRFSGEELWKTSWVGAMKVPFFASRNGSWIRSTPAVDEASIYVAGMRDVLTCLHAETGKVRWSRGLQGAIQNLASCFWLSIVPSLDQDPRLCSGRRGTCQTRQRNGSHNLEDDARLW